MKLSYQVVSVDRKKKIFPHNLLVASILYVILPTMQHKIKKNITNNTVGLEIVQKQNKKI